MAMLIYITIIYFCKRTGTDASSNRSLYLKIETQFQYLFSNVASQDFSAYFSHPIWHNAVPNYCLVLFPSTSSQSLYFFFPSYLLIVLPPCSSPLASNSRITDLLHLNSTAYLSIQVLQSCMIPVTWQPLWASWVSTKDWRPFKSWSRGWEKE